MMPDTTLQYFSNLNITTPVKESELKIALKELKSCTNEEVKAFVDVIESKLTELSGLAPTEDALGNILQFLKTISEDSAIQHIYRESTLTIYSRIIFSLTTTVIRSGSDGSSCHAQKSVSWLHKAVKVSLYLVKATLHPTGGENSPDKSAGRNESLYQFGIDLLDFLKKHSVATLDIRCNVGLVLCHIGGDVDVEQLLRKGDLPNSKNEIEKKFFDSLQTFMGEDYVNRISISFGALGTRKLFSCEMLEAIVKQVLLQVDNNSTKEAVNLGSARLLEIWMDKIREKVIAGDDLSPLRDTLFKVEVFIFTYMAGHIDAVKTCCRNMLSNLSIAYSYLEKDGSLLESLLVKLIVKPFHVKWVGLAATVRSNPKSIMLLDVLPEAPKAFLSADRTFKHAASEVYLSLMVHTFPVFELEKWLRCWITPLFKYHASPDSEPNWSQKKHILSKSLSSHGPEIQKAILTTIVNFLRNDENAMKIVPEEVRAAPESYLLVVEGCKIGAELEISIPELQKPEGAGDAERSDLFRGMLPRAAFNSWTYHANPQIRLAAFSLLVETKKTSEVLQAGDMDALRSIFKYNIVSQNPAFRQQFYAFFKKLMRRLKDGRSFCRRMKRPVDVQRYDDFVQWMWSFFIQEGLFPGANFSRRCQSLLCLTELILHFPIQEYFSRMPERECLVYLRWLEDTYENNKIAATTVLSHMKLPMLQEAGFINAMTARAMELLTSVRPPDSVSGRYLLLYLLKATSCYPWNFLRMLLTKLEMIVQSIKKSTLLEVSSTTPPYGILRAIRLIFSEYKDLIGYELTKKQRNKIKPMKSGSHPISFDIMQEYAKKLMNACFDVNEAVFPVLGSAAPEGFLPDLNENPDPKIEPEKSKIVRSINAQMLLVSSWRSMKEVCLLLTEVVLHFPVEGEIPELKPAKTPQECVITFEDVKTIGDHLVYLLMNLMHRGVFEQVFVGFKCLTQRLKKAKTTALNTLSQQWLENVMVHVGDKCTTRRSAGLPFIFQAVLTPEVINEELIHYWMTKLLQVRAEEEDSIVRIHKMNILRALFRDANFARAIMQWVPEGVKSAIRALRCNDWGEQNSGLMLYGAVIRRTFGPRLNLMSAPTFFRKFPDMYDFLLNEIKAIGIKISQHVMKSERDSDFAYHLLLLFSCFATAPGTLEEGDFKLSAFIPNIQACGACGDVQVRTMASKALIPFIASPTEREVLVSKCLDNLLIFSKRGNSNAIHGSLLQLASVLRFMKDSGDILSSSLRDTLQISIDIVKTSTCPQVCEAFADVSIALWELKDPGVVSTALTMQKLTRAALESKYSKDKVMRRNDIVGLPHADEAVSKAMALMDFDEATVSSWVNSKEPSIMEQLLKVLSIEENEQYQISLEIKTQIIANFLELSEKYLGQTDYELSYLIYFAGKNCDIVQLVANLDDRIFTCFLNRLMEICTGTFGTIDCKAASLQCLGKLIFSSSKCEPYRTKFIDLLFEWMDTKTEDELREGVAASLPSLSSNLENLSALEYCKLWTVILTLAQDDERIVRHEVLRRLTVSSDVKDIPGCDLKCIEILVEMFINNIEKHHSLEGFLTLIGLLVRDDYDVIATVADDDEEDRLFERSEMNMYAENVTLLNIVNCYFLRNPDALTVFKSLVQSRPAVSKETQTFIEALTNINVKVEKDKGFDAFLKAILEIPTSSTIDVQASDPEAVVHNLFRGNTKSLVTETIKSKLQELFLN